MTCSSDSIEWRSWRANRFCSANSYRSRPLSNRTAAVVVLFSPFRATSAQTGAARSSIEHCDQSAPGAMPYDWEVSPLRRGLKSNLSLSAQAPTVDATVDAENKRGDH